MNVKVLCKIAIVLMAGGMCLGQIPEPPAPGPPGQPAYETLPFRFEFGGYENHVNNGYGDWRGADAQIWYRGNEFFIPAFFFESQTRPTGTQQNYAFFSYLNWTKNFYTTQGISGAPQNNGPAAIYFPKLRFDIKANWKLPPTHNFVLGVGFTHFDLGTPGHGQIFNLGGLWYHKKFVVEGNLFVNRNSPGALYSSSGSFSMQYGQEGKYWLGTTVSGGHELYRFAGQTPFDVNFNGYSFDIFYRKWIARHTGIMARVSYQNKIDAFQRIGGSVSLFFDF
jgi:YaiO family outer membrane protein